MIRVTINNVRIAVEDGTTVAAAIVGSGTLSFRRSIKGEPRGPLCGMGVCFECRVTIDGMPHQRSCMVVVIDGMEISTDE